MSVRRISVPTTDMLPYWQLGWAYVMPDFDTPNHSILEWLSDTAPRVPAENRVPETLERKRAG